MKQLALLRHAKSSWDDPALNDLDRPLNKRGRAAALAMGRIMPRTPFDLVVASPARRVVETVAGIEQGLGRTLAVRTEPAIYEASADDLLHVIRGFPETASHVLMIGHHPGLQALLLQITRDDRGGFRQGAAAKFPTAALAMIDLAVGHWPEVGPAVGQVTLFVTPRELG